MSILLATLVISARDWLWPAVALFSGALLILFWCYGRGRANPGVRAACIILKVTGLGALAVCLLEPLWSGERARPGANSFLILADNSQSMRIKDRGQNQTRGEQLIQLLAKRESGWQTTLNQTFQVRSYLFDSRLHAAGDFTELNFDGRTSSLVTALETVRDRFQGRPLAGVLVFTDGNATDLPEGGLDVTGLPPVFPVMMGRDMPARDLEVRNVTVSQTSFEDAPVTIQAEAAGSGYGGSRVVAQLVEAGGGELRPGKKEGGRGGGMVQEQSLRLGGDGEPLNVRFQFRPRQSGVSFYQVRVSERSEVEQFARPEISREATLANNTRWVMVDRGQGPYRILYVGGRPNWEYKFLNRALMEDDQIELVGLIRVAKREPKFEFKGRAGESSNPLFRGFDAKGDEETERYDQPVIVRLNTRDAHELSGGFPKTAEELYAYHAVILDDVESGFFTHDQMSLLQRFVSERGGGFLMLGGQESFGQGEYERTPIGTMLPVYADRVADARPLENLELDLSKEGWLQPWARLRSTEAEEETRLREMPGFQVFNRTRGIKPGASVIATVIDGRNERHPALVVQRFGHGRSAALMVGDMWRWGLREETMQKDLAKSWRQLARWLVADVPVAIQLQVEAVRGDPNQAMLIQARVRDKRYQPLDNAEVRLTISPVTLESGANETNSITLTADAALSEEGLYEAVYIPRETGGYQVEARVKDLKGAEVGRAVSGWTSDPAADEFRSLQPNSALLESIAFRTGGEIVRVEELDSFARRLPSRKVPVTETWTFPLWHSPWVFLFALGCFMAEWGLRRWKGLA
jgi:uncharacterized membrane protein